MRDFIGKELKIGDLVVYAERSFMKQGTCYGYTNRSVKILSKEGTNKIRKPNEVMKVDRI